MDKEFFESGYILDFDGVICDSNLEVYATSLMAYLSMIGVHVDDHAILDDHIFFDEFIKFRDLGRISSDFYNLWIKVFQDNDLKKYLPQNEEISVETRSQYRATFFSVRENRKRLNMNAWLSSNIIYEHVVKVLNKALKERNIYIASAKDEDSIYQILQFNGFNIDKSRVFGSQKYIDKDDIFKAIIQVSECKHWKYIEDNMINVEKGKKFGFECYYATWGYGDSEANNSQDVIDIIPGNLHKFFNL